MSKITRKDKKRALKKFEGQADDRIEVDYTTHATDDEKHRLSVFKYLEDKGFVVTENNESFLGEQAKPTDGLNRIITGERVYRITALGRDYSRSFVFKAFQSVVGNIPTIVISVLTVVLAAVAVDLWSAYSSKEVDLPNETLPVPSQKDTSLPTAPVPSHKHPPVPASPQQAP